jgi:RNA 3'-phosphate cyclase
MLEIDGAYGEGGGQLLRTAVALAAITRRAVRISNIRAGRARPGLAAQHVAAVRAVAALCDARVTNLVPRATEIEFEPGAIRDGTFRFEIGTAGSATLVLQALIPVALAGSDPCRVVVQGGSDVRGAPPADYLRHVLLALLGHMGVDAVLEVRRRGYYPRGGGELELALAPAALRAQRWDRFGRVQRICGHAHVARLESGIAERMRDAALQTLGASGLRATINVSELGPDQAAGPGGAVAVWAQGEASVLGAARVAERGVRAESLGADAARELASDIATGAALDTHAADQILIYLALARGESSFATRELTSHARTAMWLIERFLPVRFAVDADGSLARVRVLTS